MDIQKLLTRALLGGVVGLGTGYGAQYLSKGKYGSPGIGASIGAGMGAFLEALRQNKEEKNKNIKAKERLEPGLYYMERGIWGDQTLLKGTAFHQNAKHGLYVGVYDQKPEGIETQKLPNGQYIVTFGGYPNPKRGNVGLGDLYFAINGASKVNGLDQPNDYLAVKSLIDKDLQKYTDFAATMTPVNLDPVSSDQVIRKMYDTVRKYENTSFGEYGSGFLNKPNNCLTLLGILTNSMDKDIDINKLPSRLGGLGGLERSAIPKLKHLSDWTPVPLTAKEPATSKVVAADYEPFQRAARHVLRQRLATK